MKIQLKVNCCDEGSDCCKEDNSKQITIDFLYLDLSVCERCQSSSQNLDEAMILLTPIFNKLGYKTKVNRINVNSEVLAKHYKFKSSPTIRVNNDDIELEVKEDNCKSCGELCGDMFDCRVFTYNGLEYHEPPVQMIIESILKNIYFPPHKKDSEHYDVPDNLLKFYRNVNKI